MLTTDEFDGGSVVAAILGAVLVAVVSAPVVGHAAQGGSAAGKSIGDYDAYAGGHFKFLWMPGVDVGVHAHLSDYVALTARASRSDYNVEHDHYAVTQGTFGARLQFPFEHVLVAAGPEIGIARLEGSRLSPQPRDFVSNEPVWGVRTSLEYHFDDGLLLGLDIDYHEGDYHAATLGPAVRVGHEF